MRRKWLKTALIVVTTLTLGLAISACTSEEEAKYDYIVTFDYNEPNLGEGDTPRTPEYRGISAEDPYIYVKPGEYGTGLEAFSDPARYVSGWYLPAELDEETGEPVRGEDGAVLLGREWDFKADKVEGDMTLYAALRIQPHITIVDVEDETHTEVAAYYGMPGTVRARPSKSRNPSISGKTFYEYYDDENCETLFDWQYEFEETEGADGILEGKEKIVYAKFLAGTWEIVSTAADFNNALSGTTNIYLDADISFAGEEGNTTAFTPNKSYNGELNGNGHTVSGITVTLTNRNGNNVGVLFNELGARAYVHDIIFEDVKVTFASELTGAYNIAMVANSVLAGARIANVKVSGSFTTGEGNSAAVVYRADFNNAADAAGFDLDTTQVIIPE